MGMSSDKGEDFEERPAIMEFDGGLSREEAEKYSEINMKLSPNNQN
ncbi:MAG: hypothetical protein GF307_15165 [candidate division Zixibacteria bacterium]|nr:hypothetical protein [candidate division Zixibacteria bacterium]